MSKIKFLKSFLKKPGEVGAILPSSRFLAAEIVSGIDIEKASAVVELGPGTGIFTEHIQKNIAADTHFFVVERNDDIYKRFIEAFPDVKAYNRCASELKKMMSEEGVDKLDAVVSGLPWASFPVQIQNKIIGEVYDALSKDGFFTTFAYLQGFMLPAAHRFKKLLNKKFKKVKMSKVVWRNAPPAFVYRCIK